MSLFIAIEGADGAGKSTLIGLIENLFRKHETPFHTTREPGGTLLGEKIREIILHNPMSSLTELLLYEAARAEHVQTIIEPALKAKKIVLTDRFSHSSLAYQGIARGLGEKLVESLNKIATTPLKQKTAVSPDLIIWLKLSPEAAISRIEKRATTSSQNSQDRFEMEKKRFHETVYKAFLKLSKKYKGQYIVLEANQAPEKIFADLQKNPLWKKKLKRYFK